LQPAERLPGDRRGVNSGSKDLRAWCAGIALALYGIASVVFARFHGSDIPYPGSVGTGWGIAAVIGGLGFIAVAEWEARRSPGP
jgi:hypothetical protein